MNETPNTIMHTAITLAFVIVLPLSFCTGYPELLFANRKDIRIIEVGNEKQSRQVIVKDVTDAASVDYYYKGQLVCWTDIDNELIKCVEINKTGGGAKDHREVIKITRGIISPDGLAVDWLGEKLYWTDSDTNKIEVAELYSKLRRVLFWQDLDQPRAIALVPSEGLMFWTDWGENPKIERAGMNGDPSTRWVIVSEEIYWPNGLTVDYNQEVIYWADARLSYIASVDFEGNSRTLVMQGKLPHPFALTYFNHTLYWTDLETRAIHYCNVGEKRFCEDQKQLGMNLSPMSIHVYDQARQPHKKTPCQEKNGGCSHLCLAAPAPNEFTCACPTGVKLIDNYTCSDGPEEMLIFARRTELCRISLDTPDHAAVVMPVSGVEHAIAVDYDPIDGFVYWTDDKALCIQRAKLDGSEQQIVVSAEVFHPDGVAVDWIARNLYWTDTGPDRIEVARLNGTSRKIIIAENLDEPRAIAVDPDGGLMFWTDWGKTPKIERAALDGSLRRVIIDSGLMWPNGVAIDFALRKIYWCDAQTDKIEMASLDGSERRVVVGDRLQHVFGFSLLGDFLYWTDWQRRSIERVNKLNGDQREVIIEHLSDLMGLKAVNVSKKDGFNPCGKDNGGCSHLCLNRPTNYTCGCPIGYELTLDEKQCVVPEDITSHNVSIPVTEIQEAMVQRRKFLTAEQKKFYNDNGYVVLDILSEAEIEELSEEYDDIFKRLKVQSIHGLQMHSAAFTRLLLNPKMLDACEDIMETENILLHHTKAHTKPPGAGSPFPMHQDYHYFPFENDSMVAVFISMDAADPENGGLCVYPGSHKLGPQEDCSNAPGWHYLNQEKFPISKATPLSLKRGQIVVFSYLLIHGSYDNTSDRIHRMVLIQLISADDTPLAKVHQSDCQNMVLRGKCVSREADIKKRHQEFTDMEKEAGM